MSDDLLHPTIPASPHRADQSQLPSIPGAVQKIDALHREVHLHQERARLLKEEIFSNVASDINNSLYVLSLVSALLLPPSLIFALFGVSVGSLPLMGGGLEFAIVQGLGIFSSTRVYAAIRGQVIIPRHVAYFRN